MSLSRSEQSRINGARSKGPKTPEGKHASSRNALEHGLCAEKVVVLQNERPAAFDQLHAAFVEKFRPQDNAERELVLQAVAARWRLRRIWQLETTLFDLEMDRQRDQMKKNFSVYDEGTRQALAFESLVNEKNTFAALSRYETRISREYDKAIRALNAARAAKPAEPSPADDALAPAGFPDEPGTPAVAQAASDLPNEPESRSAGAVPAAKKSEIIADDWPHIAAEFQLQSADYQMDNVLSAETQE
jgi:hypothetical protein